MSKARKIINHFFYNEQSEDTREKFFDWLLRPVSSFEREEAMRDVWENLHVEADSSTWNSYRQVHQKLHIGSTTRVRSVYMKMLRIAAVFLLPLLSALFVYLYVQNYQPATIEMVECFVPNGQIREIMLPDSSFVIANSGSIVIYPENFAGNKRVIYLNGEAKFTVKSDRKKPFIVKANDMSVEALGTVFNVSSYSDNEQTIATLVEGKVKVDFKTEGINSEILSPGEQVIYDRTSGQAIRKTVRTDYVMAWEAGHLIFQSASLQQVVKTIERRYDVVIYLNSGNFTDEKITVKFIHDQTLDEVLQTLQYIIKDFKYKIADNKVYIY